MNLIDEMINKWETEKKIHEEILQYKKKMNELNQETNSPYFDLDFQQDFLTFLEETTAAVQKFKSRILKNNA